MDSLVTYLTMTAFLVLLCTYSKFYVVLSILRFGLTGDHRGFGLLVAGLSLVLSVIVLQGEVPNSFSQKDMNQSQALYTPYLQHHTSPESLERTKKVFEMIRKSPVQSDSDTFHILLGGFVLSELTDATKIGLGLLIPFIALDIIIANLLALLGVLSLNPQLVSFPLKLLLFVTIDGWTLLVEKLLGGFA